MTKAETFYNRHAAQDEEALVDALDAAAGIFIDGKMSGGIEEAADALANNQVVKMVFSDLSVMELVPLAGQGLAVSWGPR